MTRSPQGVKLPLIARAAIGIGLATLAASTLAMFSVGSMQRSDLSREMLARGDAQIRQFAMATSAAILVEDAAVLGEIARNLVASEPDIDHVEVRNEEELVLARAGDPDAGTRADHMVREESIEVAGENFGSVRIAWNLRERLEAIRSTSRQTAAVVGLILVVTGGLALWILHRIAIRPIRLIESRLRELDPSGEIPALELYAPPEIQRLNAAVDQLAEEQRSREKLELQVRQGQKMEAVGRLAGGVAHNFNNSLTVVLGYVDMLRDYRPADPELQQPLDAIEQSARHAAALTTQLLAVGRQHPQRPQTVSVENLLQDAAERLAPILGEGVQLEVGTHQAKGHIHVDPGLFESVILNLVANARDALPGGGRIVLRSETANEADCRRIDADPRWGAIRIGVEDDGVGMAPEILDKLFDPFFTTKREGEGTGLGLSTVYGFVDQSGGYIEAKSEEGSGSSFHIILPCVSERPGEVATTPAPQATLPGKHALLVEDEAAVRRLLVTRLEVLDLEVTAVQEMASARKAFASTPRPFDLMITDIGLPDGSGVELAVWLRTFSPLLPVLFVTGYGGARLEERIRDLPCTALLQKPFSAAEIEQALHNLLQPQLPRTRSETPPAHAPESGGVDH